MAELRGIDISQHQGQVDFAKVRAAGHTFVICKCSEGQDFRDPEWSKPRAAAVRAAGLRLGVYHYLRPRPGRTGDVEADWAVKTARAGGWGKPGDLRLVVDIEETALASPALTRTYLAEFVERAERLTGHLPVIYSFPSFLARLGLKRTLGCPLWIAHFEVAKPTVPAPWDQYLIWQHSSKGFVPGVSGHVDLNRARALPTIPDSKPKPPPRRLGRRQRIARRARRARRRYLDTRADRALRVWLVSKARLGRWDERYCLHWGPDAAVNDRVKAFVTRGFAAGLVPTSLRRGQRFAGDNSHHTRGNAGDLGVRRELLPSSSPEAQRRMRAFQAKELRRARRTGAVELELIGPDNADTILAGRETDLAEGTPLEQQHDTHVHGAFA